MIQEWSNIDKLLVKSRATQLQGLQTLAEMQEYLEFMAKTSTYTLNYKKTSFFFSSPFLGISLNQLILSLLVL